LEIALDRRLFAFDRAIILASVKNSYFPSKKVTAPVSKV